MANPEYGTILMAESVRAFFGGLMLVAQRILSIYMA